MVNHPSQSMPSSLTPGQFVCRLKLTADTEENSAQSLIVLGADGHIISEIVRAGPEENFSTFSVSPDGRWIAYTCYLRLMSDREPSPLLYATSIGGHERCQLTRWDSHYQPCYFNPRFSPRGDRLVCEFALEHPSNPNLMVLEVNEIGGLLYATRQAEIINPLRIGNHAPQFLPDGERIVYFGNYAYEDLLEVCFYDPRIAEAEMWGFTGARLTQGADGVWRRPKAIAVQPEWEQVFFIQGHMSERERIGVLVLSDLPPGIAVSTIITIGSEYDQIGGLETSPDGQWLAFDADDAIYVTATDGSGLRRLTPESMSCRAPAFSRDSSTLTFLSKGALYSVNLREEGLAKVTGDEMVVEEFVWF